MIENVKVLFWGYIYSRRKRSQTTNLSPYQTFENPATPKHNTDTEAGRLIARHERNKPGYGGNLRG